MFVFFFGKACVLEIWFSAGESIHWNSDGQPKSITVTGRALDFI